MRKSKVTRVERDRRELGLTQVQMARRLGVSFATVNRWENSRCRPSPMARAALKRLFALL